MTSSANLDSALPTGQDLVEQMAKYGITRIPVDYFYYNEFRYTRLEDAISHAKRQRRLEPSQSKPVFR